MPTKKPTAAPTTTKTATAPKIVDIAHPDTVKTNATGVPIIVTNRPILRDPMVVDDTPKASEGEEAKPKTPIIKKIELKPLTAAEKNAEGLTADTQQSDTLGAPELPIEKAVKESKPVTKADENEAPKPAVEPQEPTTEAAKEPKPEAASAVAAEEIQPKPADSAETPKPEEKPATQLPEEPAADDSEELLPDAKSPVDEEAAKAARAAAEKQLAIDKLISEGTYVLPINMVEKRRIHRTILVVLLIVLVLGLAGLIGAMDAGYLTIPGVPAPTNFIKN